MTDRHLHRVVEAAPLGVVLASGVGWVVGRVYEGTGSKLKSTPARAMGGGRAAVTDKRKTVSEGNPIGGRQHRDIRPGLVRRGATGRGHAPSTPGGEEDAWLHPQQRLPENRRVVRRQKSSMADPVATRG
ncbi:hypothetical protein KM043_004655 [Ampulex compressa]|nr:hypothetical protein KM043_004655 [Ampulex compressa]